MKSTVFSLRQLSEDIKSGNLSPTDLIEVCIDKIKNLNPRLGAFITVVEKDELIKKALIAENEIKKGNYRGPLHGIPFSVKDIFYVKGLDAFVVPTTIIPAPRFGQEKVDVCRNVTLDTRQALLRNTIVFNSIGLPSVSIPIGLTKKYNLPVGAQIIGAPFKEQTILSIAYCHERISIS